MATVLNGYDLMANQSAHKLKTLEMEVAEPLLDSTQAQINIPVTVLLNMDCRFIECKKMQKNIDYTLKVFVVVLLWKGKINQVSNDQQLSYSWDRETEVTIPTISAEIAGRGEDHFPYAVLGFKKLAIDLDRDHWFVDFVTAVHPNEYQVQSGLYTFDLHLLFRVWKSGMRHDSAARVASQFAFRRSGRTTLQCSVVLIQFQNGCVIHKSVAEPNQWRGRGLSPSRTEAVETSSFLYQEGCVEW
ncbi:MAG TPA: hypothetical protein VKA68_18255 [bacterium]|nr:hypothetical protein [bacterium]